MSERFPSKMSSEAAGRDLVIPASAGQWAEVTGPGFFFCVITGRRKADNPPPSPQEAKPLTQEQDVEDRSERAEGKPAIEEGDVVRLNSGGPAMTVRVVIDEVAHCRWMNAAGDVRDESFQLNTIYKSSTTSEEDRGAPPLARFGSR